MGGRSSSTREKNLAKLSEDDDCGAGDGGEVKGGERVSGNKMTPLSLDALEDVLRYTDHTFVQECRLVCWEWNAFIQRYPKSFKQRCLFPLLVISSSVIPIDLSILIAMIGSKKWTDLDAFKNCCKEELEAMSDSMAGELLVPNSPEDEVIRVLLYNGQKMIKLKFANRLTSSSAFHLLHFLKHLEGCSFGEVFFGIQLSLPSAVPFTIHFRRLQLSGLPPLSYLQELTATTFKPQVVDCDVEARQLEQAIGVTVDYGQLPFSIVPRIGCASQEEFDEALEYFYSHDVRSLVSEVLLRMTSTEDWNTWPMERFDPQQAINGVEEQERGEKYLFGYVNEQSGKEYFAEVQIEEEKVDTVTIKFDI